MNGADYSMESGSVFTYTEIPSIVKMSPAFGSIMGGTTSSLIVGEGFEKTKKCRYGDEIVDAAVFGSEGDEDGSVECASPPGHGRQAISISTDGVIFSSPLPYAFAGTAFVTGVYPNKAPATGGTEIRLRGMNFTNSRALSCKFGDVMVHAQWHSPQEIRCLTPRHVPSTVLIEMSNNGIDTTVSGHQFTFYANLAVNRIYPNNGPEAGGTTVRISGLNFIQTSSIMCKFGNVKTRVTEFISSSEIICITPPSPTAGVTWSVPVEISNNNLTFSGNGVRFTYDPRAVVLALTPSSGYDKGGSRVMVYGSNFQNYPALSCSFGSVQVPAYFLSRSEIECISPPHPARAILLEISLNGFDYTFSQQIFNYVEPPAVKKIWPLSGPGFSGGTLLTVTGNGFVNSQHLLCRFGQIIMPAAYLSDTTLTCRSPPGQPGLVSFEVSTNAIDFSTDGKRFLYYRDVAVSFVRPTRSLTTGQIPVFFRGTNFMNSSSLGCRFGENKVRAVFVSPSLLVCVAPAREIGSHNVSSIVTAEVTNNGLDYSGSNTKFQYRQFCPPSKYCPHLQILMAPNGTATGTGKGQFNFTLCKPGEFQPRRSQSRCLKCPVGFVCPDFGMSKPDLCPAGFVCQALGLREPKIRCPAGHYCMAGTKTDDPADFAGLRAHSKWSSTTTDNARLNGYRGSENYAWLREPETGLVNFNKSTRAWLYLPRPPPATGESRPEHEPMMLTGGLSRTTGHEYGPINILQYRHYRKVRHDRSLVYPTTPESLASRGLLPDNETLLAEMPFPCPIGTYCRTGATHNDTVQRNFSRPQKCLDGFFCPFGSNSPEGSGPCPTGFYCPRRTEKNGPLQKQQVTLYEAIVCPEGMYCPGVGNTGPIDCYPGTYNPFKGQSNCTTCPSGHICPGWKRTQPLICPAGFVCMSEGLSAPVVQCPAGYFCRAGTFTMQQNETYGWQDNNEATGIWKVVNSCMISKCNAKHCY